MYTQCALNTNRWSIVMAPREGVPWRGGRALLQGRGAGLGRTVLLAVGLDGSIFGGETQAIGEAVEACKAARLHQQVERALFSKLRAKILVVSIRHRGRITSEFPGEKNGNALARSEGVIVLFHLHQLAHRDTELAQ